MWVITDISNGESLQNNKNNIALLWSIFFIHLA